MFTIHSFKQSCKQHFFFFFLSWHSVTSIVYYAVCTFANNELRLKYLGCGLEQVRERCISSWHLPAAWFCRRRCTHSPPPLIRIYSGNCTSFPRSSERGCWANRSFVITAKCGYATISNESADKKIQRREEKLYKTFFFVRKSCRKKKRINWFLISKLLMV